LGSLLVLFRLDSSRSAGYIVEFRANFGIGEYRQGSVLNLLSFVFFLIFTFVLEVLISVRSYPLRRYIALTVLGMGVLLSLVAIVVSDALLKLR
jgi:hypothetical protein